MLVSVRAAGLNFADVYAALGLYSPAGEPPFTPGFEVSGVVTVVGAGVSRFNVGDRVFGMTRFGGYSTHITLDADYVTMLPADWTFSQGCGFGVQTFTAWYSLCELGGMALKQERCRALTSPARRVLVHSAAGGVGLTLVEMVRRMGGDIVATVGSPSKVDILRSHDVPADRIIVRGKDDDSSRSFEQAVRSRIGSTGQDDGVDVVVDSVLGPYFKPGWELLNRGGRYIAIGAATLMPASSSLSLWNIGALLTLAWRFMNRPSIDPVNAINQNKSFAAFNLAMLYDRKDLFAKGMAEVQEFGLPPPTIFKEFPFDQAKEALCEFQKGRSTGKLVLVIDDQADSKS